MLGSQLVIGALKRRGVRCIFSLSGNQIMPLYDACLDAGIRIVHVRHEAAAVFMADAWSQVTGEVGVAMLTAGPGLTNGIAPLHSAAQAESAVLLLSGDSSVAEDGMGAFQEMDQVAITRPLTKMSRRPTTPQQLATCVDEAMSTALAGRRGPVHLALPFDLLARDSGIDRLPELLAQPARAAQEAAHLGRLATLLSAARQPLVLAGPSSARAGSRGEWQALAVRLQAPVVSLESPRGLKDPSIGRFAELLPRSDLVLLAGKALDFTLGFGRESVFGRQPVVVLDPDPALIERAGRLLGHRLALAVQCDPAALLGQVAGAADAPARAAWLTEVAAAMGSRELPPAPAATPGGLSSRELCEQVQRCLQDAADPILVCDGGEFGQWAQAFCRAPVRIINGMSGAIGGGICYAIAAKLARPQATVVALMGDGTAGFHFMEFDTAVREHAPFVAVIGNDLRWNAEHLIQLRTYGADRLVGCELAASARYHDTARSLGGHGAHVAERHQLEAALRAAITSGLPACVNVAIEGAPAPTFSAAAASAASH